MQRVHMCHYHTRIGAFLFSLAEIQRVHFVIANMFRHIDVEAAEKRSKKKTGRNASKYTWSRCDVGKYPGWRPLAPNLKKVWGIRVRQI